MTGFDDPEAVARYAETPPRLVPGFHDLHRMARILLAEHAPDAARILVVGAGGGLELRSFSQAQPRWRFVGVDPSAEMLKLARRTLGPFVDRTELHEGYVETASPGPFDGASCLLTLHFLTAEERLATLREIRRRLRPGAALVVAHHSIPEGSARALWLDRFAVFAAANGVLFDSARGGAKVMGERLPILSPEAEVELMRSAGFENPQLFYAAFSFRGWVAWA